MPVGTTELQDNRLTVNEAAKIAGVHSVTIRKWIAREILPCTKTETGRVRIDPQDLRRVLKLPEEGSNQ